MSGRPALLMSRDVKQVLLAAKRVGALMVEVSIRGTPVIVHLGEKPDDKPDEITEGDPNNSFDKILRGK